MKTTNRVDNVLKGVCFVALVIALGAVRVNAQDIDVQLSRTQAAGIVTTENAPITIPDAPGQTYDAADTSDSGTIWNSLIASTLASNNTSGGNITFTVEQNLSLVNSYSNATSVSISSITFTENNGKNDSINETGIIAGSNPGSDGLLDNPVALMQQSWFDNGTSESITFNLTGLTANGLYNLYVYGSGQSTNYGGSYTVPSANRPAGYNAATGAYSTIPSGTIYRSVFDSTGINPTPELGLSWTLLPVQADGNGDLSFSVNKDSLSSTKGSINGFQLSAIPEPSSLALAGVGLGLIIGMLRRRRG